MGGGRKKEVRLWVVFTPLVQRGLSWPTKRKKETNSSWGKDEYLKNRRLLAPLCKIVRPGCSGTLPVGTI